MDSPWKLIPINRPFGLSQRVQQVLETLREAGFESYVVGGSVRDFLLGLTPKDPDCVTQATPDEILSLFPQAMSFGKAYGVMKLPQGKQEPLLEIATFREDLDYQDGRHPQGIKISGVLQDVFRRDFTINALLYDPWGQCIWDAVQGYDDLQQKRIRAIGEPQKRFQEDALRLLRAIRFQAQLGFSLEEKTYEAIQSHSQGILKISAERVREECQRLLYSRRPSLGLKTLRDVGLMQILFPEFQVLDSAWQQMLKVSEYLAQQLKRSEPLCWAGFLIVLPNLQAESIMKRFRFSKACIQTVTLLLKNQESLKNVFSLKESQIQRLLRDPSFEDSLILYQACVQAQCQATDARTLEIWTERFHRFQQQKPSSFTRLSGEDLKNLGFKPGPLFKELLRDIEDQILEKKIQSKEEALLYVIKRYRSKRFEN